LSKTCIKNSNDLIPDTHALMAWNQEFRLRKHFHHKILSQAVVMKNVNDLEGIEMKIVELLLMTLH
jgi:hypothetical protein